MDVRNLSQLQNGFVASWGAGTFIGSSPNLGQSIIPVGLSSVVANAGCTIHSLALRQQWIPAQPVLLTENKWSVTNFSNLTGPLPVTNSFTSHGGRLVISTAGSGYSPTATTVIGMIVSLDGIAIQTNRIAATLANTHVAFVPTTVVRTGVAAGLHTITLNKLNTTLSDVNDFYKVTNEELPY